MVTEALRYMFIDAIRSKGDYKTNFYIVLTALRPSVC